MAVVRESICDLAERCPGFEVAAMAHGEPIRTGGYDALLSLANRL